MFKRKLIISLSILTFLVSLNATAARFEPTEPPKVFSPRLENVHIILDPIIQPTISIFTNIKNVTLKDAASAVNKIYSLLNWKHVVSKKSEQFPAYVRKKHFGGWVKNLKEKSCYNTRAKVLIRDSLKPVTFKDNNCTVDSGEWLDAYSLETLNNAQDIQIDHMVPMKVAYISGAYKWDYRTRCIYGNYLGYKNHLVSAYGEENNLKTDHTPEDYMPPNDDYKCTYLKDWLYIKGLWSLTMTASEASAIKDLVVKYKCDTQKMVLSDQEIAAHTLFLNQNKNLCLGQ